MPIEPVKIPQNVYIEDRIVGPLTLKQVITVAVGGGFSYVLYAMLSRQYGALPLFITVLVWIPCAISVVFAFLRINDLSMFRLCLLLIEKASKPPVRTWTPRKGLSVNVRTFTSAEEKQDTKKLHAAMAAKSEKQQQIEQLSAALDIAHEETAPETEPAPQPEQAPAPQQTTHEQEEDVSALSVNRARIKVNPLTGVNMDDVQPPETGSVSIFRDIAPRTT